MNDGLGTHALITKAVRFFFFLLLLLFVISLKNIVTGKWFEINACCLDVDRITSSWLNISNLLFYGKYIKVTVYISPCHLLATGCCQGADMVRNFRVQLNSLPIMFISQLFSLSRRFL